MSLVLTSAGVYLNEDAARSYEALNLAFRARFGRNLPISSGARTYNQQAATFRENYNPYYTVAELGRVERRYWNGQWWYRKPWRATVAVPGTSNHEYPPGKAADFGGGVQNLSTPEHEWMRENAGDYGWEWTGRNFSTVEPWHWEKNFRWSGGGSKPLPTPTPNPEPIPEEEEDDMPKNSGITWERIKAGTSNTRETVRAIVNTGSGFNWAWSDDNIKVADMQEAFDIPAFKPVTEGAATGIINACKAVLASK